MLRIILSRKMLYGTKNNARRKPLSQCNGNSMYNGLGLQYSYFSPFTLHIIFYSAPPNNSTFIQLLLTTIILLNNKI